MPFLSVTTVFAALFLLALVGLSVPVSVRRARIGVLVGEGDDVLLRRLIRAHGNFVEYAPLGLIGLGLVEAAAAPLWLVISIGSALLVGRIAHAIGMWRDTAELRGIGIALTHLSVLVLAGTLIAKIVSR
jgi:uncharacterized membrane protein YecN with MAPEG domain